MNIILYFCANTRAVRVRWLLEELDLKYQLHTIDIFSGQGESAVYKAIHPYGQVPAIDIDGEIVYESGAICSVLTAKFPAIKLAPDFNTEHFAQYQQWLFYAVASLEPHVFHYLLHSAIYPDNQRVAEIARWNLKQYQRLLATLEKIFIQNMSNKKYLINDQFSTADIMLASILFWTPKIIVKYPNLQQYASRIEQRDAYQRALAD